MSNYPLLIKGFFANPTGTNQTIVTVAGSRVTWNNVTAEGRGNMIMCDVVMTNGFETLLANVPLSRFNLWIGGMRVLSEQRIARYMVNAVIRSFELLQLVQPPAQTLQLDFQNVGIAETVGAVVHCYHENKFAIPSVIAARNTAVLKQRIVTFTAPIVGGFQIDQSQTFTIPTAIGNVVAIELAAYLTGGTDVILTTSLVTLAVNGESVFEDAAAILFTAFSGRPGLIFPIVIRPGSTVQFRVNTGRAVGTDLMNLDLRLYFDNDVSGKKNYA